MKHLKSSRLGYTNHKTIIVYPINNILPNQTKQVQFTINQILGCDEIQDHIFQVLSNAVGCSFQGIVRITKVPARSYIIGYTRGEGVNFLET